MHAIKNDVMIQTISSSGRGMQLFTTQTNKDNIFMQNIHVMRLKRLVYSHLKARFYLCSTSLSIKMVDSLAHGKHT